MPFVRSSRPRAGQELVVAQLLEREVQLVGYQRVAPSKVQIETAGDPEGDVPTHRQVVAVEVMEIGRSRDVEPEVSPCLPLIDRERQGLLEQGLVDDFILRKLIVFVVDGADLIEGGE